MAGCRFSRWLATTRAPAAAPPRPGRSGSRGGAELSRGAAVHHHKPEYNDQILNFKIITVPMAGTVGPLLCHSGTRTIGLRIEHEA